MSREKKRKKPSKSGYAIDNYLRYSQDEVDEVEEEDELEIPNHDIQN